MSDNDATVGTGSPLDDAPRLRSLAETGLAAAPDPAMDEIAERVRRQIDVPMALVSLVRPDSQLLPGVAGLGEPWASRRCAPLEHSLCHEVVRSARPLVLTDVRASERATGGLAARELGIVGYAGLPLVDAEGRTLGSLAAIDTEPRTWTNRELDLLDGLAAGCSARLQVLIATHQAERERRHTDEVQAQLRAARDRSQRLLTVSQALARLSDLNDIPATVTDLV
ncbi:MAG TPA: GAF domain-containing protein, partial [Pseudonocardiaceae bacterium]|nr:GAF domain-containing protein [Pseudonocardiaceae bacterium]